MTASALLSRCCSTMASTTALLAAIFTLFSFALAFSPDQCNVTSYGAPTKAACTTLLTQISALGAANASYLFIPAKFATPVGLSNVTRMNFPQSWSTSKYWDAPIGTRGEMNVEC